MATWARGVWTVQVLRNLHGDFRERIIPVFYLDILGQA